MNSEKVPATQVAVDDSRSATLHSPNHSINDVEKTAVNDNVAPVSSNPEVRYPGETHANVVAENELKRIQTSDSTIAYPTGTKLALITLALCLSVFLMALDNTIIATAIPKITDEFNSLPDVGWYGSGM